MAKFCSKCGKKLEEGKTCDCKSEINVMNNELVSKGVDVIKKIFTKPIDTIKEYTKADNFVFAIILTAVMSLLTALFLMAISKEFVGLFYGVSEISLYGAFMPEIEVPYFEIFFGGLISAFALTFVFAGALYLSNTIIFKGKADFKTIYSLYGVCSVITSAALLVGILVAFLNVYIGLIVLMIGFVLNMVYMIYSIKLIGPKDENKYGYIYLIAIVINMIATFIITKIFS